jgi:regulator of replication initiation timing
MGEHDATATVVTDLTTRINELETELEQWKTSSKQILEQLQATQQENNALRSRLTAVALVLRP